VTINPDRDYPDRRVVGYRADVGFRVRLRDVSLVEAVLVEAVAAGAHEIRSVAYETSRLRELREDARRGAVAAARRKAEVYCEAAGCRVGSVLHIEDVDPDTGRLSEAQLDVGQFLSYRTAFRQLEFRAMCLAHALGPTSAGEPERIRQCPHGPARDHAPQQGD